jgi:hypothetical protein
MSWKFRRTQAAALTSGIGEAVAGQGLIDRESADDSTAT